MTNLTNSNKFQANQVVGSIRGNDIVLTENHCKSYNTLFESLGSFAGFEGISEIDDLSVVYNGVATPYIYVNIEPGYPEALGLLKAVLAMYDLKMAKTYPSLIGGIGVRIYADANDIPVDMRVPEEKATKYIDPTQEP